MENENKKIPNYRIKIKKELAAALCKIEAKTKEQQVEKYDLGIRLAKFFKYEQDPEFEKIFNEFCYSKKWEKNNDENEQER